MTITDSSAVKRSNRLVSRVFNTSNPLAQNSLGWPSEKLTMSWQAIDSIRDVSPRLKHSRNSVFAALIAKRLSMSNVRCSIMTEYQFPGSMLPQVLVGRSPASLAARAKSILITIGTFRQPPNQIAGRSYSFDRTLTRKRGGIANGERSAARSQACVRISAIHTWTEYPNARSGAAPDSECVRGWAGEGICENPSSRGRCKGIRLQPSFRGGTRGPFCACGFVDAQRAAPRRAYYGSIGFRHGAAERLEHSCDSNALRCYLRSVAGITGMQRLLSGCADSGSRERPADIGNRTYRLRR